MKVDEKNHRTQGNTQYNILYGVCLYCVYFMYLKRFSIEFAVKL